MKNAQKILLLIILLLIITGIISEEYFTFLPYDYVFVIQYKVVYYFIALMLFIIFVTRQTKFKKNKFKK